MKRNRVTACCNWSMIGVFRVMFEQQRNMVIFCTCVFCIANLNQIFESISKMNANQCLYPSTPVMSSLGVPVKPRVEINIKYTMEMTSLFDHVLMNNVFRKCVSIPLSTFTVLFCFFTKNKMKNYFSTLYFKMHLKSFGKNPFTQHWTPSALIWNRCVSVLLNPVMSDVHAPFSSLWFPSNHWANLASLDLANPSQCSPAKMLTVSFCSLVLLNSCFCSNQSPSFSWKPGWVWWAKLNQKNCPTELKFNKLFSSLSQQEPLTTSLELGKQYSKL